ncbi:MAG TPA: hypothetical protein VNK45_07440 [Candidatus Acidoferrales bacterium]|nr:hypothetical protein [Candidatus Acidoferrales bacterium]
MNEGASWKCTIAVQRRMGAPPLHQIRTLSNNPAIAIGLPSGRMADEEVKLRIEKD